LILRRESLPGAGEQEITAGKKSCFSSGGLTEFWCGEEVGRSMLKRGGKNGHPALETTVQFRRPFGGGGGGGGPEALHVMKRRAS